MKKLKQIAKQAREASYKLATLSTGQRNNALRNLAVALEKNKLAILKENEKDIAEGKKKDLSPAFIDRLTLTESSIDGMITGVKQIIKLEDPLNKLIEERKLEQGMQLKKVSVPLGVILMIYESRPNVTIDAASLALKSGNAVILRGGSDAFNSNTALGKLICSAFKALPKNACQLVPDTSHDSVDFLLQQTNEIDLVIPRGGIGLIKAVSEKSKIPVLKHFQGICHTYIDESANLQNAQDICFNAKVQRPGVCNAMECMVVHKSTAQKFLPGMLNRFNEAGVRIYGDDITLEIAQQNDLQIERAKEEHYGHEFLDLIVAVKVVDTLQEAIDFINEHGSKHSEAIISANEKNIKKFMNEVDASAIFANSSTRFNDGFVFGLGAEIGISTDKLHARGPVGLQELTSYKYLIYGTGQVRE
jgi:glutamate-5-semialdehyde dehydrogenase